MSLDSQPTAVLKKMAKLLGLPLSHFFERNDLVAGLRSSVSEPEALQNLIVLANSLDQDQEEAGAGSTCEKRQSSPSPAPASKFSSGPSSSETSRAGPRGTVLSDGEGEFMKILPERIRCQLATARVRVEDVDEIFIHVGQSTTVKRKNAPLARFPVQLTSEEAIEMTDRFASPNSISSSRICLPGDAPHRLGVIRLPHTSIGKPVGFTLRLSRWVERAAAALYQYVDQRKSILLIGTPCRGKSTVLKDLARYCSIKHTTAVIDYMGELCGCDEKPYTFLQDVKRFLITDRTAHAGSDRAPRA
ncbi:single-stranded nucleic acid binding protein R3H domain-containing protein [Diplonema papillatum]|nr:single-stranded nucleic acid binding protein R3H domain-containing protein [Diplonema papillatum]